MLAVEGRGLPIGLTITSATPHESKLIEPLLNTIRVPRVGVGRPRTKIKRLIYDRAADSLKLRRRLLEEHGVDLICPRRKNCRHKVQYGRKLRRYGDRLTVERTNAWLQNYRRVATRFDRLMGTSKNPSS